MVRMLDVGAALIALGIGSLLDVNVWPAILIGVGVVYISSLFLGRAKTWLVPACCYPQIWTDRNTQGTTLPVVNLRNRVKPDPFDTYTKGSVVHSPTVLTQVSPT